MDLFKKYLTSSLPNNAPLPFRPDERPKLQAQLKKPAYNVVFLEITVNHK